MTETTPSSSPTLASGSDGRHPVVVGHLVLGIALAGLVVVWALVAGHVVTGRGIRFLLPVPWVLAGAGGLVALLRRRPPRTEPADPA